MSDTLQRGTINNIIFRESNSLRAAKMRAARQWNFCRNAIFSLMSVPVHGYGTMGVDKYWRLYYDPEFVEETPEPVLATVILHELLHLLNKHHRRYEELPRKDKNSLIAWNIATDYTINDMLNDELIHVANDESIPDYMHQQKDRCVITSDFIQYWTGPYNIFDSASAESHYHKILEESEEEDAESSHNKQTYSREVRESGEGDQREDRRVEGSNEQPDGLEGSDRNDQDRDRQAQRGARDTNIPSNSDQLGNDGSNPDVRPTDARDVPDGDESKLTTTTTGELQWAGTPSERPGTGGIQPDLSRYLPNPDQDPNATGYSEEDADQIIYETSIEINKSGSAPSQLKRTMSGISRVSCDPWEIILRMSKGITSRARSRGRRSYSKINKRYFPRMVLPTRRSKEPRIMICLDTSGSMRTTDFNKARGLIKSLLSHMQRQNSIDIYLGDTNLSNQVTVTKKLEDIQTMGGGGTDVGVLMTESLAHAKQKPDVIIAITDGYTPWPTQKEINCPVLVALTRGDRCEQVPGWIKKINI